MFLYIIVLILVLLFLYFAFLDDRRKFKKINFKDKKLYIAVFFLHGNCNLKTTEQLWDNFSSPDSIGMHTSYTPVRTMSFIKVYDINIFLKNNIKLHIQCRKSPYFIFD